MGFYGIAPGFIIGAMEGVCKGVPGEWRDRGDESGERREEKAKSLLSAMVI